MDIRKITLDDYVDFIEDETGKNSLDSKALSNFKGITTGIIKRAAKKHLIDYTHSQIYDLLDIRPVKKPKDDDKEVISKAELCAFVDYIKNNMDIMNLSLLFMLSSGLRIGEMVALQYGDFVTGSSFRIRKTETFYKGADGAMHYEVADNTKTLAGRRTAYIPEGAEWIVKEMKKCNPNIRSNPFSDYKDEYLCTDNEGNRIRAYRLRNRIYYICQKLPEFSQTKSPHKLRKTFCSILLDSGFDENLITSIMGHVSITVTEQRYHKDRKTADEKQKMLNNITEFKQIVNS